jgi:hypothetical protein
MGENTCLRSHPLVNTRGLFVPRGGTRGQGSLQG